MSPKKPRTGKELEKQTIEKCWLSMCKTREQIGDTWKWPGPLDCIRFAFQEIAEADDELMRSGSSEYLRRRDETGNSFSDEIGMCAVMLLSVWAADESSMMLWNVHNSVGYSPAEPTVADAAIKIVMAWRYLESGLEPRRLGNAGYVCAAQALDYIYVILGGSKVFEGAVETALKKARDRAEYKKSKKYLYLKDRGVHCPECGSVDIEAVGSPKFDESWVSRECVCSSCSYRWLDIYELSDMQEIS